MSNQTEIGELPVLWRTRAANLREWAAAESAACALERAAIELELTLERAGDAEVGLNDAARLSGYSPDHLGRLIRKGQLANHGTKHRPRVRLVDLPRKAQTANVEAQ